MPRTAQRGALNFTLASGELPELKAVSELHDLGSGLGYGRPEGYAPRH